MSFRQPVPAPISYTVRGAVTATGASRSLILAAISDGRLKVARVGVHGPGRRILISARSLEAWLGFEPASGGDPMPEAAVDPEAPSAASEPSLSGGNAPPEQ